MNQISVFDAKNQLSALLERVEHGAEFTITRRGKAVARLVAADQAGSAHDAVDRLHALRDSIGARGRISWEELKAYRDEGRR